MKPKAFDMIDFVSIEKVPVSTSCIGKTYELETLSFVYDSDKIHNEILLPISIDIDKYINRNVDKKPRKCEITIEIIEPNEKWAEKHKKYKGFLLVVYDYYAMKAIYAYEFKFRHLVEKSNDMNYLYDENIYYETLMDYIAGYSRISKYMSNWDGYMRYANSTLFSDCQHLDVENDYFIFKGSFIDPLIIGECIDFKLCVDKTKLPDIDRHTGVIAIDLFEREHDVSSDYLRLFWLEDALCKTIREAIRKEKYLVLNEVASHTLQKYYDRCIRAIFLTE